MRVQHPRHLTALSLLAGASGAASAQLSITAYTIDCGGGTSSGGTFTLSGTIGQPDAGPTMTGGSFALTGGFWPAAALGAPACPADFNHDGTIDPDDLSDFITGYFSLPPDPRADFNGDGNTDPDDLADYIARYFSGGC